MELELGPLRFGIIGAGRLGCTVGRALQRAGLEVVHASSASPAGRERATRLLSVPVYEDPLAATVLVDAVVVCVPDGALESVVQRLTHRSEQASPIRLRVVSTSASGGIDALAPLALLEHFVAVMHPMATAAADSSPGALTGAGSAIGAGDEASRVFAHGLAHALGMHPFDLNPADWPLHAAACTTAANLTISLLGIVEAWSREMGLHESAARGAYGHLAHSAVERWSHDGAADALGGAIVRGDGAALMQQADAVRVRTPTHDRVFRALLEQAILQATAAGRVHPDASQAMRQTIAGAGWDPDGTNR